MATHDATAKSSRRQSNREHQKRQDRFGKIQTVGNPYRFTADLYHRTLRAKWRLIIPIAIAVYFLVNVGFASLYLLGENNINGARNHHFGDAFFFSVQTLSTIGYGGMTPATPWANILVTIQAFLGIVLTALSTGLAFAKFSRPMAKIIFSQRAVVHLRNGQPCFSFRAANSRGTDIVEAQMHVSVMCTEVSDEGQRMRRLRDLDLVRDRSPVFLLSWAVMHEIDDKSPLFGFTHQDMIDDNVMVVCTLLGVDGTTGQAMTSRHVYHSDDIDFGHTLVDVITRDGGNVVLDFAEFHSTEVETIVSKPPASAPASGLGNTESTTARLSDAEVSMVDKVDGADDDTPTTERSN